MKIQTPGSGCPKRGCAGRKRRSNCLGTGARGAGRVRQENLRDRGVRRHDPPALVADNVVKSAGKVLSPEEIQKLLS